MRGKLSFQWPVDNEEMREREREREKQTKGGTRVSLPFVCFTLSPTRESEAGNSKKLFKIYAENMTYH